MTMTTMDYHPQSHSTRPRDMPVSVQIISTLLYGAFAITAVAIAFAHFWPAAVALAALLGWRGGFTPHNFTQVDPKEIAQQIKALSPETDAAPRSSGNASFDAYRREMLDRLEQEQDAFEGFLDRLRAAKDSTEFDRFMEDRAKRLDDGK